LRGQPGCHPGKEREGRNNQQFFVRKKKRKTPDWEKPPCNKGKGGGGGEKKKNVRTGGTDLSREREKSCCGICLGKEKKMCAPRTERVVEKKKGRLEQNAGPKEGKKKELLPPEKGAANAGRKKRGHYNFDEGEEGRERPLIKKTQCMGHGEK